MFRRQLPDSWRSYSFELARAAERKRKRQALIAWLRSLVKPAMIIAACAAVGAIAGMLCAVAVVR